MKILIPGGCGYIGAMLCPHLLADGHIVTAYDTQWFGDGWLPQENERMKIVKGDIRNRDAFRKVCEGQEAIIYLAGLTNNDFCEKEPVVSGAVNRTAIPSILDIAQDAGVKRFIMASSVAAYGDAEMATEETPLEPTTPYGKAKKFCEQWALASASKDFIVTVTRSASVCGESSRMRFDLTVNKMVHDAVRTGRIIVNGGEQKRSHITIQDICRAYKLLLNLSTKKISGEVFNFVAENQAVIQTAMHVSEATGAAIEMRERSDNRSYTVSGEKARRVLWFEPKRTVKDAIEEMTIALKRKWHDSTTNPVYQNIAAGIA